MGGGTLEAIFLERGTSKFCLDTSSPGHSVRLEEVKISLMENNLLSGGTILAGSPDPWPCDGPTQA